MIPPTSIKETNNSNPSFIEPEQTCQRFTLAEIKTATNDFDEALVIGRGGFGNVYKSLTKLGSANEVAIKRLHSTSSQGASEFEAEVKLLSKLHHANLVPLIGYCCEGKEMVLAYEFMPNGTLEYHLHRGGTKLSWLQRLKICIGVARALDYLHTGTSTQHGIIHRDVKTSNILLDSNFASKVSDFGLAKVGTINQTRTHVSTLVKGTYGYMDPCYYHSGQLTRKSDVYAFGVVLFEVLTGKQAVDPTIDEEQWSLAVWAQDHIKDGRLNEIIDRTLMGQISKKCLKEFASIAVNCLHNVPKRRPAMAEIVAKLESIISRERESTGFRANDGRFFNKIIYFLTGKAILMQAHTEGSTSDNIAQKSNNPHTVKLERPQPMEGRVAYDANPLVSQHTEDMGQPEVASTAVEEPQGVRFTCTIKNFSHQTKKKLYSSVFVVGGYKWFVLIYPKGNNLDHLSMYLGVADSGSLPYGWSRYAEFSLAVINKIHSKFTVKKDTQHQFHARESECGFISFMALSELYDSSRGYLINDTCTIEAFVAVKKVIDYWIHDSTGHVDLKNQGATIIKVARDADLLEQIGKDTYFDLVDPDKLHSFHMQEQMPFNQFKEEVAKQFGVPVQFQRFWIWATRQNQTYRLKRPLTTLEESQSVGQLREVSTKNTNAELNIFLEIEIGPDLHPLPPPDKGKEDILLFFKLYDPEKEELRYTGRFFVKSSGKPTEIISKLNERAGFSPDEEIELYGEVRFESCVFCERLDNRSSFRSSKIEDGDIICFQKLPKAEEKYRYPDVPSFLEYVKNRHIVHFRSLDRPKEDDFCLELSKLHTYDDVVERVAQKLNLDDPSKIRLTPHNCYSQQPKPHPIKYRVTEHLLDMLVHYNQVSDILYYEVLDIPLPELECLKTLKVAFHHSNKEKPVIHNIRLPKQSTVGDVLNEIKSKVTLSHPEAELRLLEVFNHRIYMIFPLTEKIENIDDLCHTLRAEEIPEEEKNLVPQDQIIFVCHFTKKGALNPRQVQNFGEPFCLVIHKNETLADVKVRIQKKLEVPDEEFSKWKFAFLSLGRPDYLQDYLQDSDVVSRRRKYLGLEHSDTTP